VQHRFSTAGHPESHGQAESCIKTTVAMLAKVVSSHHRDWDQHLRHCEAAHRFNRNSSTGLQPYFVLTQRHATLPIDIALGARHNEDERQHAQEVQQQTADSITRAQAEMKKQYDKRHRPVTSVLDVGKLVFADMSKRRNGPREEVPTRVGGPVPHRRGARPQPQAAARQ
jgi:hypothetical protein